MKVRERKFQSEKQTNKQTKNKTKQNKTTKKQTIMENLRQLMTDIVLKSTKTSPDLCALSLLHSRDSKKSVSGSALTTLKSF